MKLNLIKQSRIFLYLFLICLPFGVRTLVFGGEVYESGFFSPYLSHFLYLSDVFFVLGMFFLGLSLVFGEQIKDYKRFFFGNRWLSGFVALFLLSYLLSVFWSVDCVNSFIYFFRMLQGGILYLLIVNGILDLRRIFYVFVGAVGVSAVIGILQFGFQHSLGLWFLGEPMISNSMLGVAKLDVDEWKFLRAYGTFPHPNIFGGYLVCAILMGFYLMNGGGRWLKWLYVGIGLCAIALIVAFSKSAFIALTVCGVVLLWISNKASVWKWLILAFICAFVLFSVSLNDVSISERILYMDVSSSMFFENVFGVGAGNFTAVMQNYSLVKLMPWQFQPVHNVYLLILNEVGILGLIGFCGMIATAIFGLWRKKAGILLGLLLVVVIVGLFDHYFISLYPGQMLMWIGFGFSGYRLSHMY